MTDRNRGNSILNELLYIDKVYFGAKNNNGYWYLENFIEINSEKAENIILNLYQVSKNFLNSEKNLKNYTIMINELSYTLSLLCINYGHLKFVKNDKELSLLLICFFIYKSFANHDPLKFKKKEIDNISEFEDITNYKIEIFNDSDFLINSILLYLDKITLWVRIKFNIRTNVIKNKKFRIAISWLLINISNDDKSCLKSENLKYPNKGKRFQIIKDYEISFNVEISHIPYKYVIMEDETLYLYSYHYSTVNVILKTNIKSNERIKGGESLKTALDNILLNYVFISKERLDSIIKDLCEEYLIIEKNIREDYLMLIEQYKKYINEKNIDWCKNLSEQMSIYLKIINLLNIKNANTNNKRIYLPPMLCFRGRTYFLSSYSITFHKELRYCSHWGKYSNMRTEYVHPLLGLIESTFEKRWAHLNRITKFNFKEKTGKIKNAVLWIIISMAEVEKNKKSYWYIDEFIDEGISIINDFETVLTKINFEKKLKLKYLMNILEEINKNVFIKWLISKDATASVFQHYVKAVGVKDEETLKWCNFNSRDTWYDTYAFIINKWKNENGFDANRDILDRYFTRDTLKNSIMTHNYGSKKNVSIKRFLKLVQNKFNEDIDEIKKKIIEKQFINFYDFLENSSFFLNKSSNDFKKELLKIKDKRLILNDKTEISLRYNKQKIIQIESKIDKKRYTKQETILLDKLDIKKIDNSIRANYIQSLDAALVRWYYSMGYKALTIHDCFMVDYMSVSYLVATINQGMRVQFHNIGDLNFDTNKIFSIFIVL